MAIGSGNLIDLPEDSAALKAMVLTLLAERDRHAQLADEQTRRADEQTRRAEELRVEMLRLQLELERYKKWYYGPRADRLQSTGDLAQMLFDFAASMDQKPVHPDDVPPETPQDSEVRRVRRRKGRRNLANFENLPATTHVHELSAEQRACPCCGTERQEIGADESWQIEYLPGHFERIHHVRKKYACTACENSGGKPSIETAAKPEAAIDKGLAGPGLLAYIVTSKFSDYLPLYRLEDILAAGLRDFARHPIGMVRRCGRPGRTAVPIDGAASAVLACGSHRRHHHADAEQRQNGERPDVDLCGG